MQQALYRIFHNVVDSTIASLRFVADFEIIDFTFPELSGAALQRIFKEKMIAFHLADTQGKALSLAISTRRHIQEMPEAAFICHLVSG